jgi:hypothetical protein
MVIAIKIVKIIILLTSIKMDAYQHLPAKNLPNIFQQEDIALHAIYSSIKILITLVNVFQIVVIGNRLLYFKMELVFNARNNLIVTKFLQV